MTCHYPDLASASDWLKQYPDLDQYGISAVVPQTSFGGKTSGSVAIFRLVSQAI